MNLKLYEIVNLFHELHGISKVEDGQTIPVTEGLLKQKMSLKVRVYIQRLSNILAEDYKAYNSLREELQKKYATNVNGMLVVEKDNIALFEKEMNDFLSAERDIEVKNLWSTDLKIDDLASIETEEHYPIFLKLIDKD
ncbi:MAG: protein of unknown function DUF1617 [Podoviridae sp. ctrTa16]|nr:MAG: protein of unknown function DUF1617 [Podoviridae sp. ctrTa16]